MLLNTTRLRERVTQYFNLDFNCVVYHCVCSLYFMSSWMTFLYNLKSKLTFNLFILFLWFILLFFFHENFLILVIVCCAIYSSYLVLMYIIVIFQEVLYSKSRNLLLQLPLSYYKIYHEYKSIFYLFHYFLRSI